MPNELLDDNLQQPITKITVLQRIGLYGMHAAAIIGLNLVVLVLVIGILPYVPKLIEGFVYSTSLVLFMFGMCGITIATYYYGLKWNLLWAVLGGLIGFIYCFVYIMIHMDGVMIFYNQYFAHWFVLPDSIKKDTLDILLVGIFYCIMIIPYTEIVGVVGRLLMKLLERINKKINYPNQE